MHNIRWYPRLVQVPYMLVCIECFLVQVRKIKGIEMKEDFWNAAAILMIS